MTYLNDELSAFSVNLHMVQLSVGKISRVNSENKESILTQLVSDL